MSAFELSGRLALVTGSSRGIGSAIADGLARSGAAVILNGRDESRLAGALEAARRRLPRAAWNACAFDVTDEVAVDSAVARCESAIGPIDILVNNAGTTEVIAHSDLTAATDEIWRRIFSVNVLGTWHMTRACVPALRDTGDGVVVNVSSIAGLRATGSSIPYAVSKAGVNHLTVLLANVLGPEIRVNAVAPGLVDTPWTAGWDAIRETVRRRAPLRRSAQPAHVAEAVMGLVHARHITGQVVTVDGGMALR